MCAYVVAVCVIIIVGYYKIIAMSVINYSRFLMIKKKIKHSLCLGDNLYTQCKFDCNATVITFLKLVL